MSMQGRSLEEMWLPIFSRMIMVCFLPFHYLKPRLNFFFSFPSVVVLPKHRAASSPPRDKIESPVHRDGIRASRTVFAPSTCSGATATDESFYSLPSGAQFTCDFYFALANISFSFFFFPIQSTNG